VRTHPVDSSLLGILWGIVVPAAILIGSFAVTLWLYRHFTR
jgi:hypothetical protein